MRSRLLRYTVFTVIILILVAGNIVTHVVSMHMSEGALRYEREISALKRSNIQLEQEIPTRASLHIISTFARSQGYVTSGPAVRWMDPVIASR